MTERERLRQGTLGPNPAQAYEQHYTMYVLDELIRNDDRNQGNMLWTTDWNLWLIDHTRAFRLEAELRQPELLTRIRRDLLGHLRGLTPEALEEVTEDTLTRAQRSRLLARREMRPAASRTVSASSRDWGAAAWATCTRRTTRCCSGRSPSRP